MSTDNIEERVTNLEREIDELKTSLNKPLDTAPTQKDWRRVIGTIQDDEEFKDIIQGGRDYRNQANDE